MEEAVCYGQPKSISTGTGLGGWGEGLGWRTIRFVTKLIELYLLVKVWEYNLNYSQLSYAFD